MSGSEFVGARLRARHGDKSEPAGSPLPRLVPGAFLQDRFAVQRHS